MFRINFSKLAQLLMFLFFTADSDAQVPPYFNTDGTSAYYNTPMNPPTGMDYRKVQYLYAPNSFSSLGMGLGTPAPMATITTIYIKVGLNVNSSAVYSDFTIKLGQVAGTLANFGSGSAINNYPFYSGLTTCFYASTFSLSGIQAETWYPITLQSGFTYDPNQSLVLELSNTGGFGNSVINVVNGTTRQRIWGLNTGTTGTAAASILKTGLAFAPPVPCTAQPTPGNTIASASAVCPGTSVNLTLQNPGVPGTLNYQWYNKNGLIAGAVNAAYSPILSSADSFYCLVTCPATSQSAYSNPVQVGTLPATYCYCIPSSTNGPGYGKIKRVQCYDLNDSRLSANTSPYHTIAPDILGKSAHLVKGSTYSLKVNTGTYSVLSAWFDWNQNGLFESTEYLAIGTNSGFSSTDTMLVLNLSVPVNAQSGLTKMRIRGSSYGDGLLNGTMACFNLPSGETVDYFLHLDTPMVCNGSPASPLIQKNIAGGLCIGQEVMLFLDPIYQGSSMAYQWFKNGVPLVNETLPFVKQTVSGADTFICSLSCNGGQVVYSQALTINLNPPQTCYCVPITQYGCSGGDVISKVVLNTLLNSNTQCGSGVIGYENLTNNANLTTTLQRGQTYTMEVWPGPVYGQTFAVWMDFNDDGLFDQVTERLGYTAQIQGGGVGYIPVMIPCWVTPGIHRMRVRCDFSTAGGGANITPCGLQAFGETEDYSITISGTQNSNLCYSQLQLTCLIQGYILPNGTMQSVMMNSGVAGASASLTDSVTIELREPNTKALLQTKKAVLSTSGNCTVKFDYYNGQAWIVVKGRNSIPLWSASPQNFSSNLIYSFSSAANKAYGNNQILIAPGKYAAYSGDLNADGLVDGLDFLLWETDNNNFSNGYRIADMNGDGTVDGLDFLFWEQNNNAFIGEIIP